jgi:hypothetical protein
MMAPGNLRNGGAVAGDKWANQVKRVCTASNNSDGQMKKGRHCNPTMAMQQFTNAPTG